jgi:choline dehydrogenase-like flavoprotein
MHAAGSCRMTGFDDEVGGVGNPDGTVKDIAGPHVADASIMPSDCRANFTTVVIGNAMARMMKRAPGAFVAKSSAEFAARTRP